MLSNTFYGTRSLLDYNILIVVLGWAGNRGNVVLYCFCSILTTCGLFSLFRSEKLEGASRKLINENKLKAGE